ncbi:hypothetical protein FQA39_LY06825 [Lamprigera yunnana]|nr:hypothetical protein FQA39_LY06825 [Lamprigera yunnana]
MAVFVNPSSPLPPPSSFLRPESDDEESFVVLSHSFSPECTGDFKSELVDAIETTTLQDSLVLAASALEQLNSSTPSFPSMPKANHNEMLSIPQPDVSVNSTILHSNELSPDEIQQKVDFLVEENLKLKEILHQNNLAMKKQFDTLVLWQEDVMAVHKSHKEKFAETKNYIEKIKVGKEELKRVIELKEAEIAEITKKLDKISSETVKKNAVLLKSSTENLAAFELECAKKKITGLEEQLCKEKLRTAEEVQEKQNLMTKLSDKEQELMESRASNVKISMSFDKLKKERESLEAVLLDEIKSLKDQLVNASKENNESEYLQEQLMAAQMHITKLELLRNEDKDVINNSAEKLQIVENEVKEVTAYTDVLKVQLDLYKTDFEAEQTAKQDIKMEKEKIVDDLQNLQKRNEQLLKELEQLRSNDFVHVSQEEAASAPAELDFLGFTAETVNRSAELSALYADTLECFISNFSNCMDTNRERPSLNMNNLFKKYHKDNSVISKSINIDNDSGYISQNIESSSSVDSSDPRPIAIPQNDFKQVFLNEDTLLEKPNLFPKPSEVTEELPEFCHLYFMSSIPNDIVINSSTISEDTTFSGFDTEESKVLDYSGVIPIATPILVNSVTLESIENEEVVQEKENQENENMKRINLETENTLSSIQSRMMDANCNMSLFESFYSFVCKLYTKNESLLEDSNIASIDPSQLHINNSQLQHKPVETSPDKNSYLELKSKEEAPKDTEQKKNNSTPVKQKIKPLAAITPDLFSDDETTEPAPENTSKIINDVMFTNDNDYKLLKCTRESLGGLPPPPSITVLHISASEILDRLKENNHLFMTTDDLQNIENRKKSLLLNCVESDIKGKEFPDIMNLRYHGLHYNRSKVSEDFEHLCIKYTERYIGAETESTCTSFHTNASTPSKHKLKCRRVAKSPGKRLSHLARRRITFSKDSLQSSVNSANCSFIGSRTRQIMVDARKYELLARRKSPKKKSPRKTPSKSPRKRANTPNSSGKKKYMSQLSSQAIEGSLSSISSRPSATKRALFQSPPNKDSSSNSLLSLFNSARRKMTPKRTLFKSPDKQSPSRINEVCDRKRKRTDDDEQPNKISINDCIDKVELNLSNKSISSSQDITKHRTKKLMWTVAEALRSQNIDLKHPHFKVYASVLARVVRHFLPNLFTNGPRPEGSTTESMLRIARQYVFAVTRGKTVDEILKEAQKHKSRIRKPSGYVGLDKVNDTTETLQLKNKENILQDRINIMGHDSAEKSTSFNKGIRSENVERIRRVINFGEDSKVSDTSIR